MNKNLLVIILTLSAAFGFSQHVEVETSSCEAMLNVLRRMKKNEKPQKVSLLIDSVLNTKPYNSMFEHYNRSWRPNHLPKDAFKQMILSLKFPSTYQAGENKRADAMKEYWVRFYQNLSMFEKNISQLKESNLTLLINQGVGNAQGWLPPEWQIPDFYLYIHPNGGSSAFAHRKKQGYDFFQLPRDETGDLLLDQLLSTIAHESHHLGMNLPMTAMDKEDSLAFYFISLFMTEGSATKFINNAPGGMVPRIDEARPQDSGFDMKEWRAYTENEIQLFERFSYTLKQIFEGEMDMKMIQTEIRDFWLSGNSRYPAYFLGSEIFGAIYFGLGKEMVFEVMRNPETILRAYNNSVLANPTILSNCPLFENDLADRAIKMRKG